MIYAFPYLNNGLRTSCAQLALLSQHHNDLNHPSLQSVCGKSPIVTSADIIGRIDQLVSKMALENGQRFGAPTSKQLADLQREWAVIKSEPNDMRRWNDMRQIAVEIREAATAYIHSNPARQKALDQNESESHAYADFISACFHLTLLSSGTQPKLPHENTDDPAIKLLFKAVLNPQDVLKKAEELVLSVTEIQPSRIRYISESMFNVYIRNLDSAYKLVQSSSDQASLWGQLHISASNLQNRVKPLSDSELFPEGTEQCDNVMEFQQFAALTRPAEIFNQRETANHPMDLYRSGRDLRSEDEKDLLPVKKPTVAMPSRRDSFQGVLATGSDAKIKEWLSQITNPKGFNLGVCFNYPDSIRSVLECITPKDPQVFNRMFAAAVSLKKWPALERMIEFPEYSNLPLPILSSSLPLVCDAPKIKDKVEESINKLTNNKP